ncbi:MAG: hypothetical protein WC347_00995 [Smithellaceae bacterium]|jgi:hypothetical protein
MNDKIWIGYSPLADFSTAPWGVLKMVDGKVTFDHDKAFNRARLMLNAGANIFRILRRGIWETAQAFDFEDEGYFPLLREYIICVTDPDQFGTSTGSGATVWIDLFDGCSEDWMYDPANWERARSLMRQMFANLKDLPVVFGIGNEMNHPDSIALVRDVVIPEFQAAGLKPFSFGATYSTVDDWLEKQKPLVGLAWGDDQENRTYRCVHGVMDANSVNLIDTVDYWTPDNNPISIFWSTDGVWIGDNPCDRETTGAGVVHARPSPEQIKGAMRYWMGHAQSFALADGHPKFGFEYLPKARNADECAAMGVRAIADVYAERFGVYPENFGKYPDDWKTPVVSPPPVEEPPVTEPPVEPSFNLKGWLSNRKWYFVSLLILIVLLIIIL